MVQPVAICRTDTRDHASTSALHGQPAYSHGNRHACRRTTGRSRTSEGTRHPCTIQLETVSPRNRTGRVCGAFARRGFDGMTTTTRSSMKGFCLEVSGPYACFTRPEMKVERVSYDVITPSAARAIFDAILWKPAIRWHVKKIEVLSPIRWVSAGRNE